MEINEDGIIILGATEKDLRASVALDGSFYVLAAGSNKMGVTAGDKIKIAIDAKRECFYLFKSTDENAIVLKKGSSGIRFNNKAAVDLMTDFLEFNSNGSCRVSMSSSAMENGWWRFIVVKNIPKTFQKIK